jgi:serine/threonine-protein kinase
LEAIVSAALPLPDDALEHGRVLDGRYRIEGVIGGGGMARVYRAEHLGIARPVAIKVLHADLSRSREAVVRFRREATTSGRLVHPNIVTVTDFGVLADGRCFLVMEALDGETLADRLEHEGPVPWRDAVVILAELLRGLRHAHDHGVVHRDIKPENLFILEGDPRSLVKILDFGIAKLYESMPSDSRITQGGLTIGTPLYMSPEQTLDGEITPASDLYSTTVVLFEMLTGQPPFCFEDPIATMKAHLHHTPPTLRERAPELDVPDELEEIVRRGLAKMAADRISSADAYLAMLDALGVEEAAEPRGPRAGSTPSTGEPPAASSRPALRLVSGFCDAETQTDPPALEPARPRSRRLVVAGGLILTGVAIVVAYLVLRSPPDPRSGPRSGSPLDPIGASAPAPDAPASAPAANAVPPHPAAGSGAGSGAGSSIGSGIGASARSSVRSPPAGGAGRPRDRAQVTQWVTEGNHALAAGRFDEAGAQFQRALAADATAHAAHAGLAEVAYNKGDFQRAVLSAKRAVSLAPKVAAYRMSLAKAYYKIPRYDDAIAQWKKVLELEPSNERAKKNIDLARSKKGL